MSTFEHSQRDGRDANKLQKLVSLSELSMGGAILTVSILGLFMHLAGHETPLTAAIFAACFGAFSTFLFLAMKLRVFK